MSEPPQRASDGLGTRAARGAAVTLAGQSARIGVQVVSVVVLARLLSPHDYGLLAMVLTVVGIGEIFRDFGLSSAAIQAPTLSRGQRDNLFWLNAGIGLVLSLIVFLSAPLIALLYGESELVPLTQLLSITFVINGLTTQYRADRNRTMKFTVLAVSDIAAAVIGLGCAVAAAVAGWEYWALAVQQLVQCVVGLVILVASARWLPHLPDRSAPMSGLLRYGGHLVGTQLIGYVSNNIDSVIIGTRFGAAQLGIYNRGFQLLMQPLGQVRSPTTRIALPVLSRLSDDRSRFGEFVVRGQQALGYTLVAGLGLVIAAAEPLTAILLGDQWTAVAPILRLLAIAGIFQTIAYVGYWIYLSRGLTADLFRYTLVTSAIKITCIVIGASFGIVGVAAGYALAPALAWPISLTWLSRRTDIPTRRLYAGAFRILLVVGVAAGAGWAATLAVDTEHALVQVLVAFGAGLLTYGLGYLVPPIRRDITAVVGIARLLPHLRTRRR
ncbi:lipopolysaccharide biosynthesis protein [Glaciibacter superstes]|uniref:lipopolysaccharide biosynthesis protein n=1 Tax=Glaciibacter superstes TaxID=501023 RepID=UPI0003B43FBD|nr:lipopolysaccharide biosynthesis protein [Glaciibacter superstes]